MNASLLHRAIRGFAYQTAHHLGNKTWSTGFFVSDALMYRVPGGPVVTCTEYVLTLLYSVQPPLPFRTALGSFVSTSYRVRDY